MIGDAEAWWHLVPEALEVPAVFLLDSAVAACYNLSSGREAKRDNMASDKGSREVIG